jgi:hypothetical protein
MRIQLDQSLFLYWAQYFFYDCIAKAFSPILEFLKIWYDKKITWSSDKQGRLSKTFGNSDQIVWERLLYF